MSANIKVTLNAPPNGLQVGAGESAETSITIKNQSQIVDQFAVKIEGIDPSWWNLSTVSVSLFPGDQDDVKLTFRPPKEAESRAGSYPFQVKVISQANTQDFTIAEGYMMLKGFVDWEVEMSPTRVTGKSGTFHIKLKNAGNSDVNVNFDTKDPEEALVFQFDKPAINVPAGGTAQVNLNVKPKKGEPKKVYSFQVFCRSAEAKPGARDAKMLSGQLEFPKKKFPWWAIVLIVVAVLALAALAWFLFLMPVVALVSPAGGETFTVGGKVNIAWESRGMGISNVDIALSRDGGVSFADIKKGEVNDGEYEWTIPAYPAAASNCRIRVSAVDSGKKVITSDQSSNFTINLPTPKPTVAILAPLAGIKYYIDDTLLIKWSTTGSGIAKVDLQYSNDNGTTWKNIATGQANDGQHSWKVPGPASDKCFLKVFIYDSSNNVLASTVNTAPFSIASKFFIIPDVKFYFPKTVMPKP
jgi:hypothetical protein